MKMNYFLFGLVVLLAVVPQGNLAQAQCYWTANGNDIYNNNSGDVGIGVTDPGAKLHVNSAFEGGGPTIIVKNAEQGGDVAIDFLDFEGTLKGNVGWAADEPSRFVVNQHGEVDTALNEWGGNVGIGTAEPSGKLHVEGDDIVLANAPYEAQGRLFFKEHYNGNWGMSLVYNGNTTTWHSVPENCFGIVRHQNDSDGAAALIVDRYSGNVGIGVSSPQRTLHVKDVMRLEPQSSAPSGGLGDLYVNTNGKLYFHNGSAWKEVALQ